MNTLKNLKIINTNFAIKLPKKLEHIIPNDNRNVVKDIMKTEEFIQLCDWAANNLEHTIVSIPQGTLFFRSYTVEIENPDIVLANIPGGRSVHYMNASPYGNFMIDVQRPQNRYAIFETTRPLTAFNLLPLQLLLGKQLKGEQFAGGSKKYEKHWRGLFDLFKYSFLKKHFLKKGGFDCVILSDKVDSPVLTARLFAVKKWLGLNERENIEKVVFSKTRTDIQSGAKYGKVFLGKNFWYTLTRNEDFQNSLCESQFMFKLKLYNSREYEYIPIFPEFAMFSSDDNHTIPLRLYQKDILYENILHFPTIDSYLEGRPRIELGLPNSIGEHLYRVKPIYPGADVYPLLEQERREPELLNKLIAFMCNADCTKINPNIISNPCDYANVKELSTALFYDFKNPRGRSIYFDYFHHYLSNILYELQREIAINITKLYIEGETRIDRETERTLLGAMSPTMQEKIRPLLERTPRPYGNPDFQNMFVIMYLKGGNAYRILLENYNPFHNSRDREMIEQRNLMMRELTNILGKVSDFDNNLCLNPYLPPRLYNKLSKLMSNSLFRILQTIQEYFTPFIDHMNQEYVNNRVSFKLEKRVVYNNVSDYGQEYTTDQKNIILSRDELSFITSANKEIFSEFELIRAMALIPSTGMKIEKNGRIIDLKCRPDFTAEIFDISIPSYKTKDRINKWKEAVTCSRDPTVFGERRSAIKLMGLGSVIKDLEHMTNEVILSGSYHKKQNKRLRRLSFFRWVEFYTLIKHGTVEQIYNYKHPENAFRRTKIKITDSNIEQIRNIVRHIINYAVKTYKSEYERLDYLRRVFIPYFDEKKSLVQLINAFLSSFPDVIWSMKITDTDDNIDKVFNYILTIVKHKSERFLNDFLNKGNLNINDILISRFLYRKLEGIEEYITLILENIIFRSYPNANIVRKGWLVQNFFNENTAGYMKKEYDFAEIDVYVAPEHFRIKNQTFTNGTFTLNVNYKVGDSIPRSVIRMIRRREIMERGRRKVIETQNNLEMATFDYSSELFSWRIDNAESVVQFEHEPMGFQPYYINRRENEIRLRHAGGFTFR